MPRYFQSWESGLPELRKTLQVLDKVSQFSPKQKQTLKMRMLQLGLPGDQPNSIAMMGKDNWLLAVFDPKAMTLQALIGAD
jgi:hypothetical protein